MKLLLDQNLSFRMLADLEFFFPGSAQVKLLGLDQSEDAVVWEYAKKHSYAIVTKDSDFYEYSLLYGPPPKTIWLKCGNTSTRHVSQILVTQQAAIKKFLMDEQAYCLELY